MTPKEWSKFLRDLSDRENEKGDATITVCAALLDGAKVIDQLDTALERIATMPPVNEEFGYQGYDADRMSAIAREALQEDKP